MRGLTPARVHDISADTVGDYTGDSRAVVEPFVETVIRLPSIFISAIY
jgi:hypothetical protein